MRRIIPLITILTIVVSGILPFKVNAEAGDFVVRDFTADYDLTHADPQGSMRITERISVEFPESSHGLLRAIPMFYKGHSLQLHINKVSSPSGAPADYTTAASNDNEVVRIGDPNRTVVGDQVYVIDYTVRNVITFYGGYDELYWDINGDQWDQPFTAVHATIHLPAGLTPNASQIACYAGSYGDISQDCTIQESGRVVHAAANNLKPQQTLTVILGFPKGYFQPMGFKDYMQDYWLPVTEFIMPVLLLGGAGFIWWLKRGRDPKGTGTIIPQYDAPDNMSPLEVDVIMHFTTQTKALTATIIDLAIRKFIRIIEREGEKRIAAKKKTYSLQLLRKDWSALNDWEREILAAIFKNAAENDEVELTDLATELSNTAGKVRKAVVSSLISRGYLATNPAKYVGLAAAVFFVAVACILIQGKPWLQIGIVLGSMLGALFGYLSSARTALGVRAKEHILGMKLYLEVAEKERIRKLQSPDAPYMRTASTPKKTVELFEKLLPYAMVLDVEKEWAKQFADIYTAPPEWYSGRFTTFSAVYLVGSINTSLAPAVFRSFAAPTGSAGSGFSSGGGFAGGGGGGGGGGSW
jgi:uncharacterized membrane protein YgcG